MSSPNKVGEVFFLWLKMLTNLKAFWEDELVKIIFNIWPVFCHIRFVIFSCFKQNISNFCFRKFAKNQYASLKTLSSVLYQNTGIGIWVQSQYTSISRYTAGTDNIRVLGVWSMGPIVSHSLSKSPRGFADLTDVTLDEDQTRLQSRGPNSRTCVLVYFHILKLYSLTQGPN